MSKNLAEALERMVAVAQSVMDSAEPSDEGNACPMCSLSASGATEHDPDCGYRIARTQLSPNDVAEVLRLVRVLRYAG